MRVSERVKALGLPLGELVVIGGGLLDELGLRNARDIDLAVSASLFEAMKSFGTYKLSHKNGGQVLEYNDVEAWQGWGDVSFKTLLNESQSINQVNFVSTQFLLGWKTASAREKDTEDVKALEQFYANS